MTPSISACSAPIRFCPPSPRVKERHATRSLPARKRSDQSRIFVIRVRDRVHRARRRLQTTEQQTKSDCARMVLPERIFLMRARLSEQARMRGDHYRHCNAHDEQNNEIKILRCRELLRGLMKAVVCLFPA